MNIFKNKNEKWCYEFRCNNRRVRRVVGLARIDAEEAMHREFDRVKRERFGLARDRKEIRFDVFADEFIEKYAKANKKSWSRDETSLGHLKPFFKDRLLSEIFPDQVADYIAQRKKAVRLVKKHPVPISPSTVNRELALLKTILAKAVEWQRIESNPAAKIKKFREPRSRERILTPEEMRRLVDVAAEHLKPIIIVGLNTGMRRNEILSLKWRDMNFDQRSIFIEDSKSGKSRKVPMNDLVVETFKSLPRNSEFVFMNGGTGKPIKDVKTSFHTACREAKIKGFRFHDLRHTALWRMVEAGADLVTVMKIAGHSSIQMTVRYAHPNDQNKQRAVDALAENFGKMGKKAAIEPDTAIAYKSLTPSSRDN
jgi:integrase